MVVSGNCAGCGKAYNVGDHAIGKKFKCKHCGNVIEISAYQADVDYSNLGITDSPPAKKQPIKMSAILGWTVLVLLAGLGLFALVMSLVNR